MSTITPDSLDVSPKDYASLRRRLFQLIGSVFPTWTDTDVANFGNILVELEARAGEVLVFYQDRQGNESRITTSILRKNMLALAKLVGFTARGAVAAQATEQFTLGDTAGNPLANSADVILAAGTIVKTLAQPMAVSFQLLAPLTIPAGQTSGSATVENSTSFNDSFISSSLASQTFRLSHAPYLDGSLVVSAGNGTYTQVADLLGSTSTDLAYYVTTDENDSAVVTFGDGNLGAIPTGTVFLAYRTWGGLIGKVAANAINSLPGAGAFSDVNGNPVRVIATNPAVSSAGVDRQGLEELRQLIPKATRVQRAAVAREDFEIGALEVLGVARALHLTSNEDASIGENAGFLYIVPVGGGAPSQGLLNQVQGAFFQVTGQPAPMLPCLSTFQLSVVGAIYQTVDVYAKVYKRKGATGAAVKAAILAALNGYFAIQNTDGSANEQIDFGYYLQADDGTPSNSLAFGDLFVLVDKAAGVLKCGAGFGDFLLNGQHADVVLATKQFPVLGSVEVYDADASVLL
jgi:hypothetical protein